MGIEYKNFDLNIIFLIAFQNIYNKRLCPNSFSILTTELDDHV